MKDYSESLVKIRIEMSKLHNALNDEKLIEVHHAIEKMETELRCIKHWVYEQGA